MYVSEDKIPRSVAFEKFNTQEAFATYVLDYMKKHHIYRMGLFISPLEENQELMEFFYKYMKNIMDNMDNEDEISLHYCIASFVERHQHEFKIHHCR
jgi:hypothetical protein